MFHKCKWWLWIFALLVLSSCTEIEGCGGVQEAPVDEGDKVVKTVLKRSLDAVPAYRLEATGNALQELLHPEALGLSGAELDCYCSDSRCSRAPADTQR